MSKINTEDRIIGVVGTEAGASVAKQTALVGNTIAMNKQKSKPISQKKVDSLGKKMLGKEFYKSHITHSAVPDYPGAAVFPESPKKGKFTRFNVINANLRGEAYAAHEFGHVKNYKALGRAANIALKARGYGPIAGGAAAVGAAAFDPDSKKGKSGPIAMAAGWAPTLIDEGAATYHATKQIGLKALKTLGPAFGTYAAVAGASVGAVEGIRRLRSKHLKKRNKGMKKMGRFFKTAYVTTLKGKKTNAASGVAATGLGSFGAATAISGYFPGMSRTPSPKRRFLGYRSGVRKLDWATRALSGLWGGAYLAAGVNSLNESRRQYTKGHRKTKKFLKKIKAN